MICIEAPHDLFSGPDRIAIQECASICYETLKSRVTISADSIPASIRLTLADIVQHRKPAKPTGMKQTSR
jgi:hypothetical protein